MTAHVYSVPIYNHVNVATGGLVAYTVPAGYTGVITAVTLTNWLSAPLIGTWASPLSGCYLTRTVTGAPLTGVFAPYARTMHPYYFDLHHVMPAGEQLWLYALEANWSAVISGYQLLLP
jgi:hypothetical protein